MILDTEDKINIEFGSPVILNHHGDPIRVTKRHLKIKMHDHHISRISF